jgi:Fe-S cluster biosynthesis and repair protein YggX
MSDTAQNTSAPQAEATPRTVLCVKLSRELPAISRKPFKNELGERIYQSISEEAWAMWKEQAKMLLNEYRLNLALPEAQDFLMKQCEAFFFGAGSAAPAEFTPPTTPPA